MRYKLNPNTKCRLISVFNELSTCFTLIFKTPLAWDERSQCPHPNRWSQEPFQFHVCPSGGRTYLIYHWLVNLKFSNFQSGYKTYAPKFIQIMARKDITHILTSDWNCLSMLLASTCWVQSRQTLCPATSSSTSVMFSSVIAVSMLQAIVPENQDSVPSRGKHDWLRSTQLHV